MKNTNYFLVIEGIGNYSLARSEIGFGSHVNEASTGEKLDQVVRWVEFTEAHIDFA